jgi:hypothetical protein
MKLQRHFYLRALGIISIKAVAHTTLLLLVLYYFLDFLPVKVLLLSMNVIFFLVTFLFGEWIFSVPRIPVRGVPTVIVATYAMDVFLNVLMWSYLFESNAFYTLNLGHQLIMFTIYTSAMIAAYYDRRRLGIFRGPVEGIAN